MANVHVYFVSHFYDLTIVTDEDPPSVTSFSVSSSGFGGGFNYIGI